jgi:hypothetical protein
MCPDCQVRTFTTILPAKPESLNALTILVKAAVYSASVLDLTLTFSLHVKNMGGRNISDRNSCRNRGMRFIRNGGVSALARLRSARRSQQRNDDALCVAASNWLVGDCGLNPVFCANYAKATALRLVAFTIVKVKLMGPWLGRCV